jgi:hypothetical protein
LKTKLKELYLEGKSLDELNNDRHPIVSKFKNLIISTSIETNLYNVHFCRNFTYNAFWYDCINKTIIDSTGQGIDDVLNLKLRIPVLNWDIWMEGNPTKLMRYMKMKVKGYFPVDT